MATRARFPSAFCTSFLIYPHPTLGQSEATPQSTLLTMAKPDSGRLRLPPTTNAGALDVLPLELLHAILPQLDLRSLLAFRTLNRRAAELVDSLLPYQAIKQHAADALRDILRIETASWITCRTLYEKLCTPACEECGDFGACFYILTCKRVCTICSAHNKFYHPMDRRDMRAELGLDDDSIIDTLPRMRVSPATYNGIKITLGPAILFDRKSATHAALSLYGSYSAIRDHAAALKRHHPRRSSSGTFRHAAITRAPWFNTQLQKVDSGIFCGGCPAYRQFTVTSFDDHLKTFGNMNLGSIPCVAVRVGRKWFANEVTKSGGMGTLGLQGPSYEGPVGNLEENVYYFSYLECLGMQSNLVFLPHAEMI